MEAAAALLALVLTGLWSYLMARAGVWAAVRHVTARHDAAVGHGGTGACLRCLKEGLNAHRAEEKRR